MSHLETLENVGISINNTGDIMIEANMFSKIAMQAIGVEPSEGLLFLSSPYGEINLCDPTFHYDYAEDNGFLNLGAWIGRDTCLIFYIKNHDFENKLKKSNKKLYNAINEEIEKNLD